MAALAYEYMQHIRAKHKDAQVHLGICKARELADALCGVQQMCRNIVSRTELRVDDLSFRSMCLLAYK